MVVEREQAGVLVVSGTQKGREYLTGVLPKKDFNVVAQASGADEAKRILLNQPFDIIIVNTPLTDEYGLDFALCAAEDTGAGVMVLVKGEAFEQAVCKVEDFGVLTVIKPNSRENILQTVHLMTATRARLRAMEKKNFELKRKMEEVRLVSRAKWALIESEGISEGDAHRRIEKQAMDRRLTRRQIAEEIILNYKKPINGRLL